MTKIPNLTLMRVASELQQDTLPQTHSFGHWKLEFEIYL
jgi:hypothetical protein